MGRKHNRYTPRYNPEADREKRSERVLKVIRMVDADDSSLIAGIIRDLRNELPEGAPSFKKIPVRHPVFIFDPFIVRKEFHQGFQAGIDWQKAKQEITEGTGREDILTAKLGKIVLLGPESGKRILASYVESREAVAERKELYSILGSNGLRGFNRRQHRTPPAPVVVMGQFAEPIRDVGIKEEVLEMVDTALIVHNARRITLGPAQTTISD